MQIPEKLHKAMARLNVLTLFAAMTRVQSFEEAQARLDALKAEAERTWKELAMEAHPDRGGSTEEMQELNAARDLIVKLHIERPQPRPQVVFVQVRRGFGGFYTSSTSPTTTGWW